MELMNEFSGADVGVSLLLILSSPSSSPSISRFGSTLTFIWTYSCVKDISRRVFEGGDLRNNDFLLTLFDDDARDGIGGVEKADPAHNNIL